MKILAIPIIALLPLVGCTSAAQHRAAVQDDSGDRVTVGKVQREVRVGMSSAGVIEVLGSPNIVSTDANRNEVWVYDKIATNASYSSSSAGIFSLILGGSGDVGGAVAGNLRYGASAESRSQRTMTVVIYFDKGGAVRDFAYHLTRF